MRDGVRRRSAPGGYQSKSVFGRLSCDAGLRLLRHDNHYRPIPVPSTFLPGAFRNAQSAPTIDSTFYSRATLDCDQLRHHVTVIDEATGSGSGSVKSTIVTKIRPFMIFMFATTIGAAAASLVQVLAVIDLVSADTDPANPNTPEYFSATRYATFDLFAPVTVFVFSCALYYAWKTRPSAEAALAAPLLPKSHRSARQSAPISSVEAAARVNGDGANAPVQVVCTSPD